MTLCPACGLRFLPSVDHAVIRGVYDRLAGGEAKHIEALRRPVYDAVFGIPGVPSGGRCLDVGCGAGTFLEVAASRGFRAIGVDPSTDARAGAHVLRASFPCAAVREEGPFDLVTFLNSLNYFDQPVAALAEARRLLVPGGVAVVRVPNDRVHRAAETVLSVVENRVRWRSRLTVTHPRSFTARAVRLALRRAGFSSVRVLPSAVAAGDPYATGVRGLRTLRRLAAVTTLAAARCSGGRLLWSPSLLAVAVNRPEATGGAA
jgi:2-polyprenyl-3-methyl-5-hydroxy-6-metoxy-1,4-benzoquinol methylase